MIDDGLFQRFPCDAVFALHNWPDLPVGAMGVRSGPFVRQQPIPHRCPGQGRACLAARTGRGSLICASHILQALQTVISRNRAPDEPAVLSVTQVHGGDAVNVIPQEAWLGALSARIATKPWT
ncbi:hypothetical protein WJ972_20205 [Achromobacter insuavis]